MVFPAHQIVRCGHDGENAFYRRLPDTLGEGGKVFRRRRILDGLNHHRRIQAGQNGRFVFAYKAAGRIAGGRTENIGHNQHAVVVGKFLKRGNGVVDDVVLAFRRLHAEYADVFRQPAWEKMMCQLAVGFAYGFVCNDEKPYDGVYVSCL